MGKFHMYIKYFDTVINFAHVLKMVSEPKKKLLRFYGVGKFGNPTVMLNYICKPGEKPLNVQKKIWDAYFNKTKLLEL